MNEPKWRGVFLLVLAMPYAALILMAVVVVATQDTTSTEVGCLLERIAFLLAVLTGATLILVKDLVK